MVEDLQSTPASDRPANRDVLAQSADLHGRARVRCFDDEVSPDRQLNMACMREDQITGAHLSRGHRHTIVDLLEGCAIQPNPCLRISPFDQTRAVEAVRPGGAQT